MNTKLNLLLSILIAVIIISGCANSGMFLAMNQTTVELSDANYEIVVKGLTGDAMAGYIFGVSYSLGSATETFALARIEGTGMLYKEALERLWKNYEDKFGSIEGKKVALINVHYDTDILNLLVYTQVKIYVRADVIEFKE